MHEFNALSYIVHQAKWLQKEKGILESVVQKPGKNLPQGVIQTVCLFYENDEMPWMKNCVTVKKRKCHERKIVLL